MGAYPAAGYTTEEVPTWEGWGRRRSRRRRREMLNC